MLFLRAGERSHPGVVPPQLKEQPPAGSSSQVTNDNKGSPPIPSDVKGPPGIQLELGMYKNEQNKTKTKNNKEQLHD
jgi:hypothetical protein